MDKTEFMEKLKKAAEMQAEEKKIQKEAFVAHFNEMIKKIRERSEQPKA